MKDSISNSVNTGIDSPLSAVLRKRNVALGPFNIESVSTNAI